jgi:prefoldin subunit 5
MSMRINIENILQSPQEVFSEIIQKLTALNIANAQRELSLENTQIDEVLLDAIEMVLRDLNNEEGYISRLLYSIFGLELKRNKRREQLIILGSQLKAQCNSLKKDIFRVKSVIDNIDSSIKNLNRLKEAFKSKQMFIYDQSMVEKSNLYIGVLNEKESELDNYKTSLMEKLDKLSLKQSRYKNTLKKIPRYNELSEEVYLRLMGVGEK